MAVRSGCRFRTSEKSCRFEDDQELAGTVIQIDTREKDHAIQHILAEFDKQGVQHFRSKLYVGDYQRLDNGLLVVDRKQNLTEIASNLSQQHQRFKAELERAKKAKIRVVVLCEHGGTIRSLDDVAAWDNPRLRTSPGAMTGDRMAKIMRTMAKRYNVRWEFCDKRQTGRRILEILQEDTNGEK